MRRKVLVLAFAVSALTLALVATVALGGDKSRMKASLPGYEEVPAVSSMAHGEFVATIDDESRGGQLYPDPRRHVEQLVAVRAHSPWPADGERGRHGLPLRRRDEAGGLPREWPVTGEIRPADIQTTFNAAGTSHQGAVAGEWAEFVAALRAGVAYANVHTAAPNGQPGGEIRGQINDKNQRGDRGDPEGD